jgi:hypothetical protein
MEKSEESEMRQMLLWQVTDETPKRLNRGGIDLEKHLEDWIERDPGLLQSGLTIVGRQVSLEGGGLDLLALDPQGRWVVIEIKRGRVRRETVAQALDYAACIARLPDDELRNVVHDYVKARPGSSAAGLEERILQGAEEGEDREVVMFVVGTGVDSGLERLVDYLSDQFNVPINVVSYEVFELAGGQQVLVRELTESEAGPAARHNVTAEELCSRADLAGIGREFRMILEAAQKHGIHARPWKNALMYTPPSNRARTLFTAPVWTRADGLQQLYVAPEAFPEFYPVSEEDAKSLLGQEGTRPMTLEGIELFVTNLDRLFEIVAKHEAESEE